MIDKTQYILELEIINKDSSKSLASSVVLNKDWILTAYHNIQNSKRIYVIQDKNKIFIEKNIGHSKFEYHNYGYYDIALCRSENSFKFDKYLDLYTNKDESGHVCEIFGFYDVGCLMKKSTIVHSHERTVLLCESTNLYSGESGGALFINNSLAGINSLNIINGKDKSFSCHTRISEMIGWIESSI